MATANLTPERLRELLHYDPDTGLFTNRISRGGLAIGDSLGCIRKDGYVVLRANGALYCAQRLAWFYVHGTWPQYDIDHIDGNPSNNRLVNLRDVPRAMNIQNQRRARSDNTSGFLGVSFKKHARRYVCQISLNGTNHFIGYFDTPEAAHAAYVETKRRLHAGNTL